MINCKGCKYENNYDICRCKECGGIGSDEFRWEVKSCLKLTASSSKLNNHLALVK